MYAPARLKSVQRTADRYCLRGDPVPSIFPGTLTGLQDVMRLAGRLTLDSPDVVFRVIAVYDGESRVIRFYKDGDGWAGDDPEQEDDMYE